MVKAVASPGSSVARDKASRFHSAVQSSVTDTMCGPWSDWTPCSIPCGAQGTREMTMTCTDEKGETITHFKIERCEIICPKPIRTYPKPPCVSRTYLAHVRMPHSHRSHWLPRSLHLHNPLPRHTHHPPHAPYILFPDLRNRVTKYPPITCQNVAGIVREKQFKCFDNTAFVCVMNNKYASAVY